MGDRTRFRVTYGVGTIQRSLTDLRGCAFLIDALLSGFTVRVEQATHTFLGERIADGRRSATVGVGIEGPAPPESQSAPQSGRSDRKYT